MLDFLHTAWIACALWDHLISHFGQAAQVDFIPWSLAVGSPPYFSANFHLGNSLDDNRIHGVF